VLLRVDRRNPFASKKLLPWTSQRKPHPRCSASPRYLEVSCLTIGDSVLFLSLCLLYMDQR